MADTDKPDQRSSRYFRKASKSDEEAAHENGDAPGETAQSPLPCLMGQTACDDTLAAFLATRTGLRCARYFQLVPLVPIKGRVERHSPGIPAEIWRSHRWHPSPGTACLR
mmetsp:Transcript_20524/g.42567  ORF Transcript_20524/g.42567 Transcript_20524/m.42567 type:complete len:110 (+) Transcript_20524:184-513(+)